MQRHIPKESKHWFCGVSSHWEGRSCCGSIKKAHLSYFLRYIVKVVMWMVKGLGRVPCPNPWGGAWWFNVCIPQEADRNKRRREDQVCQVSIHRHSFWLVQGVDQVGDGIPIPLLPLTRFRQHPGCMWIPALLPRLKRIISLWPLRALSVITLCMPAFSKVPWISIWHTQSFQPMDNCLKMHQSWRISLWPLYKADTTWCVLQPLLGGYSGTLVYSPRELYKKCPHAEYIVVHNAGHSMKEPGILSSLQGLILKLVVDWQHSSGMWEVQKSMRLGWKLNSEMALFSYSESTQSSHKFLRISCVPW